MKKLIPFLVVMFCGAQGFANDDINQTKRDTESIWQRGAGSEDGAYTASSLSMLGWGVGLAAGIGILASVLHQSTAGHTGHCD